MNNNRIIYPSKEDIKYGLCLKHFATQLPSYATRYDLSVLQLLEVQCVVGEYLDLLAWRLQHTTTSIVLQRHSALTPAAVQVLTQEAATHHEYTQIIYVLIGKLVAHVRLHPAYTDCDGQALQLDDITPLSFQLPV